MIERKIMDTVYKIRELDPFDPEDFKIVDYAFRKSRELKTVEEDKATQASFEYIEKLLPVLIIEPANITELGLKEYALLETVFEDVITPAIEKFITSQKKKRIN